MSVKKTLENRHSVRKFDTNFHIPQKTIESLVIAASTSPNGNNIQATRYLLISDPQLRAAMLPIANNQQQVVTASNLILMLGDYAAFEPENILTIHEQEHQAGFFDAQLRDYLAHAAIEYYRPQSKEELAIELTRDVSLASMSFVLMANEAGFQTITMSGYDSKGLKKLLNISERYLDVMLIALGKGLQSGHQTLRHPLSKVLFQNSLG